MKSYDYVFGQNYIEMFREDLMDECGASVWDAFRRRHRPLSSVHGPYVMLSFSKANSRGHVEFWQEMDRRYRAEDLDWSYERI